MSKPAGAPTRRGLHLVWTLILLNLTVAIGEPILERVGKLKWLFGFSLVGLIVLIQLLIARRDRTPDPFTSDWRARTNSTRSGSDAPA